MSRPIPAGQPRFAWVVPVVCWGLAFVLACWLAGSPPEGEAGGGVAGKVMGDGRNAVSASLYEMAELYFHKGVERADRNAVRQDWFQRSLGELSPRGHRHAEGRDSAEILPWLRMATRTDPHNVEAFLVTAFWLATGINRPDLASQVLSEAQRHNPRDYRIPQEQGRLAIHDGKFSEGRRKLEAALVRWPSGLPDDRQAMLDKAELYILLGFLCEDAGERVEAVGYYKNALAIFPERAYINDRVTWLQGGREPELSARMSLELLVKRTTEHVCDAESGDHDHGREEHETIADRKARAP